ncbi:calcium-binding and coiled-coil domain-containing protein 1 [Ditylenchus destructor]|uniref:Calcium-binding and coiled-coil domain-containing protein 1 n=1 Tax=Ditylenchus destructor TaxID=166010 RepID=A0AAD4MJB4_9BILA|nr:calcium-binding and coiled-coil domain-containing protein 1 [Ditylenchus destructor]
MLAMFQIFAGRMKADGRVAAAEMANGTDKDIVADKRTIWGLRNTPNDRKSSTALPPPPVHRISLLCRPIKSAKESSPKEKTCRESPLRISEGTAHPTTTPEAKENREADQRPMHRTPGMSNVKNSSCKSEAPTTLSKVQEEDANDSNVGKLRKEHNRLKAKIERRKADIAEKEKCIEDLKRKAKEAETAMAKDRAEMGQLLESTKRKLKEKIKELEQDVESKEAVIGEMIVERQKAYQPFLTELQEQIVGTQKAKEELKRVCEKWRSRNTEECERLRKEKSTLVTDLSEQKLRIEEYQSRILELEHLLKDKECTLSQEIERRAELSKENIDLSKELCNYKIEKLLLEGTLAEQKARAEELEANVADVKTAMTEKECAWSEDRKSLCHEISCLVVKVLDKETENSTAQNCLAEERARGEEYKFRIGRLEAIVLEKEQSLLKEKELQTQLFEEIAHLKQQLSSTQNAQTSPLSLPSGSCNAIFSDISSNSNRCHTNLAENTNRKRNGEPNCSDSTPRKRANCVGATLLDATDEIKYSSIVDLVNDANNESGNVNGGDEVSAFVDMLNYATLHDRKPENIESTPHLIPGHSNAQHCQQQSHQNGNNSWKQNRMMQLDHNLKEAFRQSGGILTGKLCMELCQQNDLTSAQVERWFFAQQNIFMGDPSASGQFHSAQKFDTEILEAYFQKHQYVDINRRERISKIIGWSHPEIAQWFVWRRHCLKTRGVGQSGEPPQSGPIQQVSPGTFANYVQRENQSSHFPQMAPLTQMRSPPLLTSYADNSPDSVLNLFTQELGPNNFPIQHLGSMPMSNGERTVNCAPYYEQNRRNLGMQFQPTSHVPPQNPQPMNPFHARHPMQPNNVLHTLLTRPPHLENDYFAAPPAPSNNAPTTSQHPPVISQQLQSRE